MRRTALIMVAALGCVGSGGDAGSPPPPRLALADSLRASGRVSEALDHYRVLRDSLASARDTANLWRASIAYANALTRLSRFDSAQVVLAQASHLAAGDKRREASLRTQRALMHSRRGRLDSALIEARLAQRLARDADDLRLEAGAVHVLGEANSLSGNYAAAIAANERLLTVSRELRDTSQIALAFNQLAIDYRHVGRFDDATRVLEQALVINRRRKSELGIAQGLYNLSNVIASTGDLERAIQLREEALGHAERLGEGRGQSLVLTSLGAAHLQIGNRKAAKPYLVQALALGRELGLPYQEVVAHLSLGELSLAEGKPGEAEISLRAALSLSDSLHYGRQRGSARAKLARAAIARGDRASATRLADEAVSIADSLGDPEGQFEALQARGVVLEATGGDASAAYLRAMDLLESTRGRLALGDLRVGVAEPWASAYEGAVRTLIAAGRFEDAFIAAERARARLLLDILSDRGSRATASTRIEEVRQRLREREEARRSVRQPELRIAAAREIATMTVTLDSLEATERSASITARVRQSVPATLQEIRFGLLPAGRALVAFHWGDSAVYGWWITQGGIRGARLGSADSLEVVVDFLRGAVERPDAGADWKVAARRGFDALLAPLKPTAETELLAIVDGPLAYVPLEVLIPGASVEPLGATHLITYAPSASVALHLASAPRQTAWKRAVLAVGNPAGSSETSPSAERSAGAEVFAPLPYAAEEARAIGRMFERDGADVLLGREATMKRWLGHDPGRYRFIHFAAHARVSDRRPEQTHVVLADRGLDLAAIRRLQLRAELVTLSACETALGQRVRGEGVIGLPHAFLSAGARGAVVTLWRVEDGSAAEFMREFYAALHAGSEPARALHEVRRRHLAREGGEHPSRWSAFVLVGSVGR